MNNIINMQGFEEASGAITTMMNRHRDHMQRENTNYTSMQQCLCSSHGQRAACLAHVSPRGLRGLPLRLLIFRLKLDIGYLGHEGFLNGWKEQ